MKKIIWGALLFILLLSMPACSRDHSEDRASKTEKTEKKKNSKQKKEEKKKGKKEKKGEDQEAETDLEGLETIENAYGEIIGDGKLTKVSVENEEIINEKGIIVRVKELKIKDYYGPQLFFEVENNTKKDICIQSKDVYVNGYAVSPTMSMDISSRTKNTDMMIFSAVEMEARGIETLTDLEFRLTIFEADSYDNILLSDPIHIQTDEAGDYEQIYDDEGEMIYEENEIKIIGKELLTEDRVYGPDLVLYIENNSDTDISIQVWEASINGITLPASMFSDTAPGKKDLNSVSFNDSDLEANGIDDIESIEISFIIEDALNDTLIEETEPIKLTF